jgi:3-methyladenine DNA glycosylase/8-oxoguanine DNA glycosylase
MEIFKYGQAEIDYLKKKDKMLGAAIDRIGMMNLYGHKTLTNEQFEKYRKRYSPYGSVASLYLWAVSHD